MRIFLSHASHNKSFLQDLRQKLPPHINAWIDKEQMPFGTPLRQTLESVIFNKIDFFVLFIDKEAIESNWVQQEIQWALEVERSINRTFLLPVLLESDAWNELEPASLRDRLYFHIEDKEDVDTIARELADQLFFVLDQAYASLLTRLESAKKESAIASADRFHHTAANTIHSIIDRHKMENPLSLEELRRRLETSHQDSSADHIEFRETLDHYDTRALLDRLQRDSLLAGIYYDDEEIFIEERPWIWKREIHLKAKRKIARAAFHMIRSNQVVALDGGSTTLMIAQQIASGVKANRLSGMTIITNSLPAANELFQAASILGLKDGDSRLQTIVAGGHVRPTTAALVERNADDAGANIRRLVAAVGKVDIAFVGTSGVTLEGFSTRTHEAETKRALLAPGARHIIVTDPSKFGDREENIFADLTDAEILTSREGLGDFDETPYIAAGATITYA